jgi:hypothetical protein
MNLDASQLLRLLGSGVRPVDTGAPQTQGASTSGLDFAELLGKARSGELSSHKMVEVDEHAGVSLSDEELTKLTLAADKAEAAGLRTALVVFDDQQVVLDIPTRTVTGPAGLDGAAGRGAPGVSVGAPGILSGIDGVINLSTKFAPAERASTLGTPTTLGIGGTLATLLEQLEARRGQAPATPGGGAASGNAA